METEHPGGPISKRRSDVVGGYMLIEATDLAQAVELSKRCPLLEFGGSVEVRPVQVLKP